MDRTIGQNYYQAAAGANVVICAGRAILHRIIIGKDVSGGIIEISDHKTDGDGNVKIYLEDNNLGTKYGSLEINSVFEVGITADITNQTNITFIWSPLGFGV